MPAFTSRRRWASPWCLGPLAILLSLAAVAVSQRVARTDDSAQPARATGLAATSGPQLEAPRTHRYTGVMSCTATACHGSVAVPHVDATSRHEAVFWFEFDPHARAAEALQSPAGREMLDKLEITRAGQVVDERGYRNCEACHNLNPPAAERMPSFTSLNEGVSCEVCHGAAEHWRDRHYRPDFSLAERSTSGLADTKSLAGRARLCGACHVGGADREVNHDLIAAGHPVLKFELSAYHNMYPKHWRAERERQQQGELSTKLWQLGALQNARLSVEQLARRAGDAQAPWPELAESNCYACHHDLAAPSWRQARGFAGRRPGVTPYSRWYLRLAASAVPAAETRASLEQAVQELQTSLEASFVPDREAVQANCQKLVTLLAASEAQVTAQPAARHDLAAAWRAQLTAATPGPEPLDADWDSAAQLYLGLLALSRDAAADGGLDRDLAALRNRLAFPQSGQSPDESRPLPAAESDTSSFRAAADGILQRLLDGGGAAP